MHNLANFDRIFLMEGLAGYCQMEPIMNNGRLVSLRLTPADPADKAGKNHN